MSLTSAITTCLKNSLLTTLIVVISSQAFSNEPPSRIAFNRDVRPILSENCFFCHGQDANKREAELRLDTREGQLATKVIVAGQPELSGLIARIESEDSDEIMPPPTSNHRLSDHQKSILRNWIKEGAKFEDHWSFQPLQQNELPTIQSQNALVRNPIDRFVLAKLSEVGMVASHEADRRTLIRRVSLDLTGLPPTVDEVESFVSDNSVDAYERVVDRLIASRHYGERMALPWLDAARYADTHGYQKDNLRTMWLWRDWVIEAFNSNMPFDQFTIEQVAGDLLPNPSISQRIATGFNRNHRINGEAGAIAEEFRTEYVADRVETTSTVWLGLTIACARCHDHKFDPILQKDYYQLFAFFNNVSENGVDGVEPSAPPTLTVSVPGFEKSIVDAEQKLESLQQQFELEGTQLVDEKLRWEEFERKLLVHPEGAKVWSLIEPTDITSNEKMGFRRLADASILATGPNPLNDVHTVRFMLEDGKVSAIRLEAFSDDSHTHSGLARSFDGSFVLSGFDVETHRSNKTTEPIPLRGAVADGEREDWPIAGAIDQDTDTGWSGIVGAERKPHQALFVFDKPVQGEPGTEIVVRLRYQSKEEQSMIGRFRLATTDRDQPTLESMEELTASAIRALKKQREHRTPLQHTVVDQFFLERTPTLAAIRRQIADVEQRLSALRQKAESSVMVMQESVDRRETFIHLRGAYDKPGDRVEANVPERLGSIESDRPLTRLDLARWLISPSNPLTARVAVNRFWQMYFGMGLVKTTEDFGTQGEWPSHPELLDWLALEFIRSGWDIKAMQRLVVTSATYRQSSRIKIEDLERDPENRYLARGPRFRLPAHLLRDQALFASSLLIPTIGGPPVKTYQPDGLWEGVAGINSNTTVYRRDSGASLYRRSLYTFWKRAVPPPAMMIFDSADREVCSVKRRVTNTPLQALVLLNDVTYVEAARSLATRVLKLPGRSNNQRIDRMFQFVLGRVTDEIESTLLADALSEYESRFTRNPSHAVDLISIGETVADPEIEPTTLAAWTTLATLVLNLDETVTKE